MSQFRPAKEVADETGIPLRAIAQYARDRKFTSIRPSKRLFLIHVEEFKEFIRDSTVRRDDS